MAKDTNLQGLNAIAVACGGEAQESNAKAIKEIADHFSGGGGGGGGGALILTLTVQEDTPSEGKTTYTLNKTAREIIEAMPLVYIKVDETNEAGTIHEYVLASSGTPPYSASYLESENGYAFLTGGLAVAPLIASTLDDYPTFVNQGGD